MLQIYQGIFWWLLPIGIILSIVLTICAAALLNPKAAILVLIVLCGLSYWQADGFAFDGMTRGFQAARDENKTYTEKLHGAVVGVADGEDLDALTDSNGNVLIELKYKCTDGGGPCEHRYQEPVHYQDCTTTTTNGQSTTKCEDKIRWEDRAYFKYERKQVLILDIFKNNIVVVADHLAPRDYEHRRDTWYPFHDWPSAGQFNWQSAPLYDEALHAFATNQPMFGSVWNQYANFVLATSEKNLYTLTAADVAKYDALGALPSMLDIYDTIRYDPIQFNGLNVPDDVKKAWNQNANAIVAMAGPKIEASIILTMVSASKVDNPDAYMQAAKARLMDKNKFGKKSLPKNLLLLGCGVTDDLKTIQWCRVETGMFSGNNALKEEFKNLQPIPFSTQAFFGNIQATYQMDGSQRKLVLNRDGNGLIEKVFDPDKGFKRVSMTYYDYLEVDIQPTPEQIKSIIRGRFWLGLGLQIMIGIFLFIGMAWYNNENGSSRSYSRRLSF